MQSKNSKRHIIAIIAIACILMAFVDIVWQPGYILKSAIKVTLFLLFPLMYAQIRKDVSYKYLFRFDWKHFGFSIGLGLAVFIFIIAAYKIIGPFFDFSDVTTAMGKEAGITAENFMYIAVYISFINALLEEFFFRGFAYLELKRWTSKSVALIISASAFSLYHVSIMLSWFSLPLFLLLLLGLFIGGIIFNILNERSNNIYSSWMVHMFANFAINAIGFALFNQ